MVDVLSDGDDQHPKWRQVILSFRSSYQRHDWNVTTNSPRSKVSYAHYAPGTPAYPPDEKH